MATVVSADPQDVEVPTTTPGATSITVGEVPSRIEIRGLEPVEHRMYSIAFFLLSALTIYMELRLEWFKAERGQNGHHLTAIGLLLIMAASIREFAQSVCISALSRRQDGGRRNRCGKIRGSLYIIGGILYFLGYLFHAISLPPEDPHLMWFDVIVIPQIPYFVGRGAFVGLHSMLIGYFDVTNGRIPKCIAARSVLIRFWLALQVLFVVLVFTFTLEPAARWLLIFLNMLCAPLIFLGALLWSCCLYPVRAFGCLCSWIMMISWSVMFVWCVLFAFNEDLYGKEEVTYLMAIFIFNSFMLWILVRAMQPRWPADDETAEKPLVVAQRLED